MAILLDELAGAVMDHEIMIIDELRFASLDKEIKRVNAVYKDEIKKLMQVIEGMGTEIEKLRHRLSRIESSISPRGANETNDKEALDSSLEGINRLMFLLKNGLQKGD